MDGYKGERTHRVVWGNPANPIEHTEVIVLNLKSRNSVDDIPQRLEQVAWDEVYQALSQQFTITRSQREH